MYTFVRNIATEKIMKKQLTAFIAAIAITMCVGLGIFAISGVAYANSNGVQASNSPAGQNASTTVGASDAVSRAQAQQAQQIQQLQSLVAQYQQRDQQYQQREQQYQSQLSQSNTQLSQAQQQLQQYQQLAAFLQQRGIITITSNGQVYVNR